MNKLLMSGLLLATTLAVAEPLDALREFVREVKSGRAEFTQTVTAADGVRKKVSSGVFEFSRPNRFRFQYIKPFEQLIVADGHKVWIFDADLNQASSRPLGDALGSTPAALLAGGSLEKDFELANLPPKDGLEWAQATPRQKEGAFQSVRVGFKGKQLAALEIFDHFGQRSLLQFQQYQPNVELPAQRFQFKPPAGADVIEQ